MQMPKTTGLAWEIHPFNLFRLYRSPEGDGNDHNDHLKALFLLQASESGRAEDNFRFSIEGDVNIEVDFLGEIYQRHEGEHQPYSLRRLDAV